MGAVVVPAVKAGMGGSRRTCRKRSDGLLDLWLGCGLHHATGEGIGDWRGRQRPVAHHPRLTAGMSQLREYLPAMSVHSLGEAREPRHHAVFVDANLARCVLAPRVAVHVAAEYQADLVSSEILINIDEFVGDLAGFSGCSLRSARSHDSVRDFDRTNATRLKQGAGGHGRGSYQSTQS